MRAIAVRCALSAALLAGSTFAAAPSIAGEKLLYSFPGSDAGLPTGPLLLQGDTLFGTATGSIQYCCGQVFELTNTNGVWREQTLATFDNTNGMLPYGGVIADANGVLYGTTAYGGTRRAGTIFAVAKTGNQWSLQTLWQFGARHDGQDPFGPVVMDASGTLYGVTFYGGLYRKGAVFSLTPQNGNWTETLIYSFCHHYSICRHRNDGKFPDGGLLIGADGTLYGTTTIGGTDDGGTVFALSRSGGKWNENIIWNLGSSGDGVWPTTQLIADGTGALYGTTLYGGAYGYGTVFRLSQSGGVWSESVLWSFAGGEDGGNPDGGLHFGGDGTLYGTTTIGGAGAGEIFALSQSGGQWTKKVVHSFNGTDGNAPESELIAGKNSLLYGMTSLGGTSNAGTVFQLTLKR